MAITRRLMTADELLALPDDGLRHELIAGELRTMSPGGTEHTRVATRISRPLANHVADHDLGEVWTTEPGFKLAEIPDVVRVPDVAFVCRARLRAVGNIVGYWPGAPDLAVEVISPNDRYTEVEQKVAEWLAHGARMVLVADPRRRVVKVHQPCLPERVLTEGDVLDGGDVVRGWTLPVRELFALG